MRACIRLLKYVLLVPAVLAVLHDFHTDPASSVACSEPRLRKEWRSLSLDERKGYISAVQCLLQKPPRSQNYYPVVTNRYEDFVALHANATAGGSALDQLNSNPFSARAQTGIHGTGVFMPWHRYVVWVYETALREECGWTGAQPYWDWTLDTPSSGGSWRTSPIFDPEYGFGGNGKVSLLEVRPGNLTASNRTTGAGNRFLRKPGCVEQGPFKDIKLHIGPFGAMIPNNTRCLTRGFNSIIGESAVTKSTLRTVLGLENFGALRIALETPNLAGRNHSSGFHSVGHGGVGGEMGDSFTSTNDPLFFLHHAALDRVWTMWQNMNIQTRLFDTGPNLTSSFGFGAGHLSLYTQIWMGTAGPDRPVKDVMDTLNRDGHGFLCYMYDRGPEMYS